MANTHSDIDPFLHDVYRSIDEEGLGFHGRVCVEIARHDREDVHLAEQR